MDGIVLNVNALPELLHQRFNSDKVRMSEENGVITLIPLVNSRKDAWEVLNRLREKLSDGRLSTENYVVQKQIDKELEG